MRKDSLAVGNLIDSQIVVEVNSAYIKQGQLHVDTEWSHARWGYGPDGYITEFGAANAEDTVLVTALCSPSPPPTPGRERTKKTQEDKGIAAGHGVGHRKVP
jgi:hypothetical protein